MTQERTELGQTIPEYEMGQWFPLSDFGHVPEEQDRNQFHRDYPFKISSVGEFTFQLHTGMKEDFRLEEEDPTRTEEIVILSPTIKIDSILGRIGKWEKRLESDLFSFWCDWNRRFSGEFLPKEEYPFRIELKTPEGRVYSGEASDTIIVAKGDKPYVSERNWHIQATGEDVIPLVPKIATDYIARLEVRVVEAGIRSIS